MNYGPRPFFFSGLFGIAFLLVALIIVAGIVTVIVLIIRNARRVAQAGHNPLTFQTDLAVKAMDSDLLAPKKSIEQRLAELDDLLARGVITAEEHAAARARIISGE